MALTYFDVTGNYTSFTPGLVLSGDVIFTPVFHPGDIARGTGLIPATGFIPSAVHAQIVGGVLQALDGSTLQLVANTSDLNLTTPLCYSVTFQNMWASTYSLAGMQLDQRPMQLSGFSFIASTDATPIDLIQVTPATLAVPPTGIFTMPAAQISDATSFGRGFLTTVTDTTSAKSYLGFGTVTTAQISDATAIGVQLMKAANAVAARNTIGAVGSLADLGITAAASQINLVSNVTSDVQAQLNARELTANKNVANGYAGLGSDGLIPAAILPSYVDDVVEYSSLSAFPGTGQTGKIFVADDTNKTYRWSGSTYIEISPSPGSTDSVAEGSVNLYFTNARADARVAAGNAATATALATARNFQVNLASTSAVSFNGTASVTPGVTGTLPVGNGGTGATTLTGLVKGNGTSAFTAAVSGTDYAPATPGSGLLKGNGSGGFSTAAAGTDYVAPGGALGTPSSGTATNLTGLPVAGISATGTASNTTFLRGDGSWQVPSGTGSGDCSTNTTSSTDSTVALFSGTAGKTIKQATGSGLAVLASGVLSTVAAPSGTVVGTTDTQTLTNKTIDGSLNTVKNLRIVTEYTPAGGGGVTGASVPANIKGVWVRLIGSGGGGGAGRSDGATTVSRYGGDGGAGGNLVDQFVPASALGSTFNVSVSTGGAGGTFTSTSGNPGANGPDTTFSSGSLTLTASGGGGGAGGTGTANSGGATGAQGTSAGGTGGAGATNTPVPGSNALLTNRGGAGGGGGTGRNSSNTAAANGANGGSTPNGAGGAGATSTTAATSGGAAIAGEPGGGGGGGWMNVSTSTYINGANATGYGGGGGGGAAGISGTFNAGNGGNGGPGYARLIWVF